MTLTPYELERQARLEENDKLLASLGLSILPSRKEAGRRSPTKSVKCPNTPRPDRPRRQSSQKILYSPSSPSSQSSPKRKKQGSRRRSTGQNHVVFERSGRIYDSINGTSCHQCRQKTLDRKETCTVPGCTLMMCFRCLPNRYGQQVVSSLTTTGAGSWVCPRCLGVCNCSFCMKKSGRAPTGILAPEAFKLGYESVAAMLAVHGSPLNGTLSTRTVSKKRKRREWEETSSEEEEEEESDQESIVHIDKVQQQDDGEEYIVEAIVAAHLINRELYFQTRWAGYSEADDTMEPYETMCNIAAMDAYEVAGGVVEYNGLLVPVAEALTWRAKSVAVLVDAFEDRLRQVTGGPSRRQSRRLTR